MKVSQSMNLLAGLAAIAHALPTEKRQAAMNITDYDILNYALTLEHLENTFYMMALQNFTQADFATAGYDEFAYQNLMQVNVDEMTHVSFLTSAIMAAGGTPVAACTYDFGVTDVASFLATAAVLEGVGVAAYLGAAGDIMNKTYLGVAGAILSTETRHSTYLRAIQKQAPIAQPFENSLDFNEVYTLAAPFITSCPSSNPTLPVKAFPMLSVDSQDANATLVEGSQVIIDTMGYALVPASGSQIYAAFIGALGPVFTTVSDASGGAGTKFAVTIPAGVNGQSYVVMTDCADKVSDDTVVAGPAIVEIANPIPYNNTGSM